MPRVDHDRQIPYEPSLCWTEEDVRIFLALPIHLQATSIYQDGVDAKLILSAYRWAAMCGYSVVEALLARAVCGHCDAAR